MLKFKETELVEEKIEEENVIDEYRLGKCDLKNP
jgi:hypothetical protein